MSRHCGDAGRGLPVFQIEVESFGRIGTATSWVDKGEHGKVETCPLGHYKTFVKRFKDARAAMNWGRRFGTVKECRKVDVEPYFLNIEHLNLKRQPIVVMETEQYVVNRALELSRPRIDFETRGINIQVVDKEPDQ